jgi:hypothetical protein
MLKVVHTLIKYVQRRYGFICDFLDVMRSIEVDIYWLCVHPFWKYVDSTFFVFLVICEHCSESLPFVWVAHGNEVDFYCLPFLAFDIVD